MADAALRLGTRGSALALWQAGHVRERLLEATPGLGIEVVVVRTAGDQAAAAAFAAIGTQGVFTREIEDALLEGRVDIAVHSLKDLQTAPGAGLQLAAILEREDPRDALVSRAGGGLRQLGRGARIGTSSLRRRAQLLAARPDLRVCDLRGNVPTRLAKLDRGDCDAVILAQAGLARLGLARRVSELLDARDFVPAPGQGALAVQVRSGDARACALAAALDHGPTRLAVAAERAFLHRVEGGCQAPVGALGTWQDGRLQLDAMVASVNGQQVVRQRAVEEVTSEAAAVAFGDVLGGRALAEGASAILSEVRAAHAANPALAAAVER